jgi:hypothetical protein
MIEKRTLISSGLRVPSYESSGARVSGPETCNAQLLGRIHTIEGTTKHTKAKGEDEFPMTSPQSPKDDPGKLRF